MANYTTGKVDWSVRAEYKMLNSSESRNGPESFILFYTVHSEELQEAWRLAFESFPMKFEFEYKTYGRQEMRVTIES